MSMDTNEEHNRMIEELIAQDRAQVAATAEAAGEEGADTVPTDDDGQEDDANIAGSRKVDADDNDQSLPESEEPETFPRAYVEQLRRESAGYRDKAKRVDELAARLQDALVAADGRLADPSDLAFNPEYLDDPDALDTAIAELIAKKPGLRARQAGGSIGQGNRGASTPKPSTDLISIIRGMQG